MIGSFQVVSDMRRKEIVQITSHQSTCEELAYLIAVADPVFKKILCERAFMAFDLLYGVPCAASLRQCR